VTASWREKYLQALADQESSEKRSQAQLQHLKACLQALGEAALGTDPELDELLGPLLESGNKAKSSRQVNSDQITKAANKVRDRKPTRIAVSQEALDGLIDRLLALNPRNELAGQLKRYKKILSARVKNLHAYPQLLREFDQLHQQVLDDVIQKNPNWLARLFGASPNFSPTTLPMDEGVSVNSSEAESDRSESHQDAEEEQKQPIALDVASELSGGEPWGSDELMEPATASTHPLPLIREPVGFEQEPGYANIQARIQQILSDMVVAVDVDDCVRQKFIEAKARLEAGLNWYEMIATLENVRDLFVQAYLHVNQQFADYLKEVDGALLQIKQAWVSLIEGQQLQVVDQKEIKLRLQKQEAQLLVDLEKIEEIDVLKSSVASHVKDLSATIGLVERVEIQTARTGEDLVTLQAQFDDLQAKHALLQQELEQQRHKATHDTLTSLPNRAAYNQRIHEELIRWRRYQRPLCIAVTDIDHFKRFNDNYGHQTGDRVLKIIAKILRQRLREVDFVARYGGEEFVLVLPETDANSAHKVLNQIREAIAGAHFKFKDEPVSLSASFGIAQFGTEETAEAVFARADEALYRAKEAGRNRVEVAAA